MIEFITTYWAQILLSLVTAGALAFCRYAWKQVKKYQSILEEKNKAEMEDFIEVKVEPIIEDIEELRAYIRETRDIEASHMRLIIASYRYRLIQLCKQYIKQGYLLNDQFEQLTEFYKLYSGLGGNGQAKEFFDKACQLPIKNTEI